MLNFKFLVCRFQEIAVDMYFVHIWSNSIEKLELYASCYCNQILRPMAKFRERPNSSQWKIMEISQVDKYQSFDQWMVLTLDWKFLKCFKNCNKQSMNQIWCKSITNCWRKFLTMKQYRQKVDSRVCCGQLKHHCADWYKTKQQNE